VIRVGCRTGLAVVSLCARREDGTRAASTGTAAALTALASGHMTAE
jgi:hypothetical protein